MCRQSVDDDFIMAILDIFSFDFIYVNDTIKARVPDSRWQLGESPEA
jgi:hypothetical protein